MIRWIGYIVVIIVISGCATGRTDFKVIKQATPEPITKVLSNSNQAIDQTPVKTFETSPLKDDSFQADSSKKIIVQPGDTLSELCEKVLNNAWAYPTIAEQNNISDPDLIHPNQIIIFQAMPSGKVPASDAVIKTPDKKEVPSKPALNKIEFPVIENKAFAPGEKLTFSVEYFGISAGYATLSVAEGIDFHNRPTYHLMATARTHPAFEWIFKVRDKIESYMDKGGLFPWRYEKHLREGSYKNDSVIEYMQLERKVSKENGKHVVDSPPWTQDVLSEFYYFRVLPLDIGQTIKIPVVADNVKVYELIVKVVKKEKIKVPAGTFDCIKVEPYLKFEGLFQHKGKMHIWVTDDERKVPVLIKSQIVIGTIDIVLRDAVVVDIN